MTLSVDWTTLDRKPVLGIVYAPDENTVLRWKIVDTQRDDFFALYCRTASFEHAYAFVTAAVEQGDAVMDEHSVEHWLMLRGFSVRVDEPPDNVFPLWKDTA